MSDYLQSKAEGYVAQWIMQNPDGIEELDVWWFNSMVGKAIAWSVIKARKAGPVTLETIKAHCEWDKTRAKPEYFDLVWNQTPLDDASLEYCIQYFKTEGMILSLKESQLNGKIKFTKNQDEAVGKIIEHIKKGTDTPKMHEVIRNFWAVKLNRKPLLSKKEKLALQEERDKRLLNKLNKHD